MSHPPTGGQRLQDRLFPVPSAFLLLLNWQQERPSPILVGASGLREYWSATAAPFAPYLGCLRPVTSPSRTRLAGPCLHLPRGPPRPFPSCGSCAATASATTSPTCCWPTSTPSSTISITTAAWALPPVHPASATDPENHVGSQLLCEFDPRCFLRGHPLADRRPGH